MRFITTNSLNNCTWSFLFQTCGKMTGFPGTTQALLCSTGRFTSVLILWDVAVPCCFALERKTVNVLIRTRLRASSPSLTKKSTYKTQN